MKRFWYLTLTNKGNVISRSPWPWLPSWGGELFMAFFSSAISILQKLVVAIGAGLGVWGGINLMEGYGNDNRATRS